MPGVLLAVRTRRHAAGLARGRARAPAVIRAATPRPTPRRSPASSVRAWRWAYERLHRRSDSRCPSPTSRAASWRAHIADGRVESCVDRGRRAGRGAVAMHRRRPHHRASYVDPPAQGAGVGTSPAGRRRAAAARAAAHTTASLWVFARERPGPRVLRAPRLARGGRARREPHWRRRRLPLRASSCERARRRHRPRRRALPPARRRRARRRAPRSSAASPRAWEAGRVSDEPPPGATGARGRSTCATSSTARWSSSAAAATASWSW